MWWCRTCKRARNPEIEHGQPKTRLFPNGYHAVYLICGHRANANRDKLREAKKDCWCACHTRYLPEGDTQWT